MERVNYRAQYHKPKSPPTTTSTPGTASTSAEPPQQQQSRSFSAARQFGTSRNFNNLETDDTDLMNVDRKQSQLYSRSTADPSTHSRSQQPKATQITAGNPGESHFDVASNWVEDAQGAVTRVAHDIGSLSDQVNTTASNIGRNMKEINEGIDKFHETISNKNFTGLGGPIGTIATAASAIIQEGARWAQKTQTGQDLSRDLDKAAEQHHTPSRQRKRLERQQKRQFSTNNKLFNIVTTPERTPFPGVPDGTGASFAYREDPHNYHTKEYFQNQQLASTNSNHIEPSWTSFPDPSQFTKGPTHGSSRSFSTKRSIQDVANDIHQAVDKAAQTAQDINRGVNTAAATTSSTMDTLKSTSRKVQSDLNAGFKGVLNVAKAVGQDLKQDIVESVRDLKQPTASLDNTRPPPHAQQSFPEHSEIPVEQIAKTNKQQLDNARNPSKM